MPVLVIQIQQLTIMMCLDYLIYHISLCLLSQKVHTIFKILNKWQLSTYPKPQSQSTISLRDSGFILLLLQNLFKKLSYISLRSIFVVMVSSLDKNCDQYKYFNLSYITFTYFFFYSHE